MEPLWRFGRRLGLERLRHYGRRLSFDGFRCRGWYDELWRRNHLFAHGDIAAERGAILYHEACHAHVPLQGARAPDHKPIARRHRSGDGPALVDLDAAGDLERALHRSDHTQVALDVELTDQPVAWTENYRAMIAVGSISRLYGAAVLSRRTRAAHRLPFERGR